MTCSDNCGRLGNSGALSSVFFLPIPLVINQQLYFSSSIISRVFRYLGAWLFEIEAILKACGYHHFMIAIFFIFNSFFSHFKYHNLFTGRWNS